MHLGPRWLLGLWLLAAVGCTCGGKPPGGLDAGCSDGGLACGDGLCPDLKNDSAHCGSCATACAATEACGGAACYPRDCVGAPCAPDQVCVSETCVDRACVGVACPATQVCAHGLCVATACAAMACPLGQVCPVDVCLDPACVGVACPAGKVCVLGRCSATTCLDLQKSAGETDVDCGGACPACANGGACAADADCLSRRCSAGHCEGTSGCSDLKKNGAETAVDCGGGVCPACPGGASCHRDLDCVSRACDAGSCASPTGCSDGMKNGNETATDCGGGVCPACGTGKACLVPSDCQSAVCTAGLLCAAPSCSDGVRNGTETDRDCGGGCPPCGTGGMCGGPADCDAGVCDGGSCAAPVLCGNGQKDPGETAIDCGGPSCAACANGNPCLLDRDCVGGYCPGTKLCATASCTDAVENGAETDKDCGGGTCPPCGIDGGCLLPRDCQSSVCVAMTCRAPSCTDGLRNGNELGVDCGGSCAPCGFAAARLIPVGNAPASIATGDFNRDGKLDLVVSHDMDLNLAVLLGDGDGGFGPPLNYQTAQKPGAIIAAKIDGDQNLDVVAVTERTVTGATLSVHHGDGDGGLSAGVAFNPSSQSQNVSGTVRAFDVDGDGDLDLISTNYYPTNNLGFLKNNGTGLFTGNIESPINYAPISLALGDINQDGKIDAVTCTYLGNWVHTAFGNGAGGFTIAQAWMQNDNGEGVELKDVTGDLYPELFVATVANGVQMYLNEKDGGFAQPPIIYAATPSGANALRAIQVVDVTGDGIADIVLTDAIAYPPGVNDLGRLTVLRGIGGGSFQAAIQYSTGGLGAQGLAIGDFNGDGKPDVAVTNYNSHTIAILINRF